MRILYSFAKSTMGVFNVQVLNTPKHGQVLNTPKHDQGLNTPKKTSTGGTLQYTTLYMYDHRQDWCIIVAVVQLCFIKNNGQRRYKYLVLGRDTFYFAKTLWFSNLLFLVVVFFNREAVYLWVHTMPLFSPTRSLIRMRQILYRGFSRKMKEASPML
jgi:hypothetical protein